MVLQEIGAVIQKLYSVFRSKDALLAEINPLVMTADGLYAADASLSLMTMPWPARN